MLLVRSLVVPFALVMSFSACSGAGDASGPPPVDSSNIPARLQVFQQPPALASTGVVVPTAPAVRLVNSTGSPARRSSITVNATLVGAAGSLAVSSATTDGDGVARFAGQAITAPLGTSVHVRFDAAGLAPDSTWPVLIVPGGTISADVEPRNPGRLLLVTFPPHGGDATTFFVSDSGRPDWGSHARLPSGRLLFERDNGCNNPRVYVREIGGLTHRLYNDSLDCTQERLLTVSPDGVWAYLAYRGLNYGNYRLRRVRTDGTMFGPVAQPDSTFTVGSASASPDGTRLVFTKYSGISTGLFVVDLASGVVTDLHVIGHTARWSPAGDLIAFIVEAQPYLQVVRPDGGGQRHIAQSDAYCWEGHLAWSPDGMWLVARCFTDIGYRLSLFDTRSPAHAQVPGAVDFGFPEWLP